MKIKLKENIAKIALTVVLSVFFSTPTSANSEKISKIIEHDQIFTTIGCTFTYDANSNIKTEIDLRFRDIKNNWTEWIRVDAENDPELSNTKYFLAATDTSNAFQYRINLPQNYTQSQIFKNPKWTFLHAPDYETGSVSDIPEAFFASSKSLGTNNSKSNLKIISRKSWGANESYRYGSEDKDAVLVKVSDYLYEKYANELKREKIITSNDDGEKYKWPLEYPKEIKKFIIHHTATTKNMKNPKQAIRDIYHYHTISKGWGDIGYNYIIDRNGNIYEGRFGGEGVIGAHAGFYNTGSIGIAVLGNYNDETPNTDVLEALSELIGKKSILHNIDPSKYSTFRGKKLPNVIGHKDVMPTACPGSNLYSELDAIRAMSKMVYDNRPSSKKSKYSFEILTTTTYTVLKSSNEKTVIIKLKNNGKNTWNSSTYLSFSNASNLKNEVTITGTTGKTTKIKMVEKSVKPGKTATFKVKIKPSSSNGKLSIIDLRPVLNGTVKSTRSIYIPIKTSKPIYSYKITDKKLPTSSIKASKSFSGYVKVKNTGNSTWKKSGNGSIKLYTSSTKSIFKNSTSTVIASLSENSVKPGKVGTFKFKFKAPSKNGYYEESFVLKIDKKIQLNGTKIKIGTYVGTKKDSVLISKIKYNKEMLQGSKYLIQILIKNVGGKDIKKEDLSLKISTDSAFEIKYPYNVRHNLLSGKSVTLNAVINVDKKAGIGKNTINISVLKNGKIISTNDEKIIVNVLNQNANDIIVTKAKKQIISTNNTNDVSSPQITKTTKFIERKSGLKNSDHEHIRVKLNYNGNPQITANAKFKLYNNGKYVRSFAAGDLVSVNKKNDGFVVSIGKKKYTRSGPLVFKSDKDAIFQLVNFEHRPAWNTNLNDNEYRGWLEITHDGNSDNLIVINDLELNDYLKGLGEVSNYENTEKMKAIIVAARSYAKYYMQDGHDKFIGKPYDLNDDPDISQRYLGYGLEKRSPKVTNAVEATNGEVVTYKGKLVKAPYFSQSDGTTTKNAKDVWGWDNAPYLVSVDDSMCDATTFAGHGVGMSGCGAKALALSGKSYKEILEYYYTGIKIKIL